MSNKRRISMVKPLSLITLLTMGFIETGSAATCTSEPSGTLDTTDVTIDGMNALDCGYGTQNNDTVTPPPSNWQVNLDDAGNLVGYEWNAYYKREIIEDTDPGTEGDQPGTEAFWSGTSDGDPLTEALGLPIDLQLQLTGTDPDDPYSTGAFTFNGLSANPDNSILVVLKEGMTHPYAWYYFEDKSGFLSGTWDTANPFGGKNLSHLAIYEIGTSDGGGPPALVPVPAAVWLFGSGLIGLVGIARRRKQ